MASSKRVNGTRARRVRRSLTNRAVANKSKRTGGLRGDAVLRPHTSLADRLRRVRLFLCDVDGVLTDSDVWVGRGIELKRFNILDGLGLKFLQENDIPVGWVSRRFSRATTERGRELKVDFLFQITGSKVKTVEKILKRTGLKWEETCFVGDDLLDLGVLKRAGFAAAPANATLEVRAVAHHVTEASGGRGAVREVVEMILKAQNKWKPMVARYLE